MGKKKYPPLSPAEIGEILTALGFTKKRTKGSHAHWERAADKVRPRSIVTVDEAIDQFNDFLVKSMISQSHFAREEFYGATKKSARKASVTLYVAHAATATPSVVVPEPQVD